MFEIYRVWNEKVNLISRKDFDNFYERHVLHSLSISIFFNFHHNTKIMDMGTGGGFPGVPLAIIYPDVDFYLVDSIRKKTLTMTQLTLNVLLNFNQNFIFSVSDYVRLHILIRCA